MSPLDRIVPFESYTFIVRWRSPPPEGLKVSPTPEMPE
jgi:hypothetical protein